MTESSPGILCDAPSDRASFARSLHDAAWREAQKHKWLESEKNGFDVGHQAIEDWYQQFWAKYCRSRRLEHLAGEQQWAEFAEHEFGRMYELLLSGDKVLEDLIDRFEQGWENLHFTEWCHKCEKSRDEINGILKLLEIININIARLEPRLLHEYV